MSICREPDDSILLKVCNSSATQRPTIFALVWPSGIDFARQRNTTSSVYPWYVFDWSKGCLSSLLCLPVASLVATFFSLDAQLDAYHFHTNTCMCTFPMKSTKVQTLGTVASHATTDCTDDSSIVGLGPLNRAIV